VARAARLPIREQRARGRAARGPRRARARTALPQALAGKTPGVVRSEPQARGCWRPTAGVAPRAHRARFRSCVRAERTFVVSGGRWLRVPHPAGPWATCAPRVASGSVGLVACASKKGGVVARESFPTPRVLPRNELRQATCAQRQEKNACGARFSKKRGPRLTAPTHAKRCTCAQPIHHVPNSIHAPRLACAVLPRGTGAGA